MFKFPKYLYFSSPFNSVKLIFYFILSRIFLDNLSICLASFYIYNPATSHAFPNPTTKGVGRVPDLRPLYWPPPLIKGVNLTLGFLLIYNAPIPFGPYSLCALILIKSIFDLLTSIGTFPTAWAASVWKNIPFDLHNFPISSTFCLTPISLFTKIVLTQRIFSYDYSIVFLSRSILINPLFSTGK